MSLRVLVIPEDPTYNGAILKPVVTRILSEVGKENAIVHVLTDPKMSGIGNAKRIIREELPARYGHWSLWLFIPDGDCAGDLEAFEQEMKDAGLPLICCAARPEVEAWALAGCSDSLGVNWKDVADHPRLKEEVFLPALVKFGDARLPDQGRSLLIKKSISNYRSLKRLCPEIALLEKKLMEFLQGN